MPSYISLTVPVWFSKRIVHHVQNPDKKLSKNLRKLKNFHRPLVISMTGTLMSNDHQELWNLVDLVETNYLGTWEEFKNGTAKIIKYGRYVNSMCQLS